MLLEGALKFGKQWSRSDSESVGLGRDPALGISDKLPASTSAVHHIPRYELPGWITDPKLGYTLKPTWEGASEIWMTGFHSQRFHWNGMQPQPPNF